MLNGKTSMNKFLKWLKAVFVSDNDPVRICEVHKEQGCAHVDGFLCTPENCDIRKNYAEQKIQWNLNNSKK